MTTLFNLFCPIVASFSVMGSVLFMVGLTFSLTMIMLLLMDLNKLSFLFKEQFLVIGIFMFMSLNLISLVCYAYPVTTTLAFNFMVAVSLWMSSLVLLVVKPNLASNVLPVNSPWYLVPFLSIVEVISLLVRPVTLSFRLLANMSAGHILLSLICKMGFGLWFLGSVFGMLELMVCMVQAFVFFMLISVYLEEGFSH